jgi:PRTRC genetic system protein C
MQFVFTSESAFTFRNSYSFCGESCHQLSGKKFSLILSTYISVVSQTSKKGKNQTKMPVQTRPLERSFSYNGLTLADPSPDLTPEQVRDVYAASYPEITTAAIEGPEASGDTVHFKFTRVIGTKG